MEENWIKILMELEAIEDKLNYIEENSKKI